MATKKKSLESLIRGIQTFHSTVYAKQKKAYKAAEQNKQEPHTMLVTCSDSRIQPDVVTQTTFGEIFVVRNIGNLVPHSRGDSSAASAIEYAVGELKVRNLVVCGHSDCGAMKALLNPPAVPPGSAVAAWLKHASKTATNVAKKYGQLTGTDLLNATIRENVLVQLANIAKLPGIQPYFGKLNIFGWVYEIGNGSVLQYSNETGEFHPLHTK